MALKDCGLKDCTVMLAYANAFVVIAEGMDLADKKVGVSYGGDWDPEKARNIAMKKCKNAGLVGCRLVDIRASIP